MTDNSSMQGFFTAFWTMLSTNKAGQQVSGRDSGVGLAAMFAVLLLGRWLAELNVRRQQKRKAGSKI